MYLTEAATRAPQSSLAMLTHPKNQLVVLERPVLSIILRNLGHSSTNHERQRPVNESQQEMNLQRKTAGSSPVPKRSACLMTLDIMG